MERIELTHFHLFCGIGGGAKGFNQGHARVGNSEASFRCIGGIDNDASAIRSFTKAAGVEGTVMDLFSREQYHAFTGRTPPTGWKEATAADVLKAAGNEHPDIVFLSAPCKGFSGLLSQKKSQTDKYQALNNLTVRGIWLMLDAFKDDLPELVLFENVPRIESRGGHLLDQIESLLIQYGYAVARTTHNCGELGGLAQSRNRFLLVARNQQKMPAFLYEPTKKPLRPVGDILSKMLLPGDPQAGPMHRVPRLQWKTWVRLAFVEAGKDWRSLNRLQVEDGVLKDYLLVPEYRPDYLGVIDWHDSAGTVSARGGPSNGRYSIADPRTENFRNSLGVTRWAEPTGTIAGNTHPTNGRFAVADPRPPSDAGEYRQYGVNPWDRPIPTITSQRSPGQGPFSVADPRPPQRENYNVRKYRITRWDEPAGTTIAASTTGEGAFAVQDPRHMGPAKFNNQYSVVDWDVASRTITGAGGQGQCVADPRSQSGPSFSKFAVTDFSGTPGTVISGNAHGAYAVADPRPGLNRQKGDHYLTGGHYGVIPWSEYSYAVPGFAKHDSGPWSVADPRLPEATDKLVAIIRAIDGTWHRPFTTLELAALQGLFDPEHHWDIRERTAWYSKHYGMGPTILQDPFILDGVNDGKWREHIGNAVPPPAAKAIASMMGEAILLSRMGETFQLSSTPVWVRPIAVALSVQSTQRID